MSKKRKKCPKNLKLKSKLLAWLARAPKLGWGVVGSKLLPFKRKKHKYKP